MTDPRPLIRALAGAGIAPAAARRIAGEIVATIDRSIGTTRAPGECYGRIVATFSAAGLGRDRAEWLALLVVDLIRRRQLADSC